MSDTLFDVNAYTQTPKSSFFDYDLDVEVLNSIAKKFTPSQRKYAQTMARLM